MSKAPKSVWLLNYENVDVSDELAAMVTSVEYTDNVKGKSDEIAITLHDREGRWRTGWWPSSGDRVDVKLGWEGKPLLQCGRFKIDEPEISGPPDTIQLRGQAAITAAPLATVTHRAFEKTTLKDVVALLARELKLQPLTDVEAIPIDRLTQGETTLAFLRRLSEQYGYAFSIRDERLIFFQLAKLEAKPPVLKLKRGDLTNYTFKAGVMGTYSACELSYLDAAAKKLVTVRVEEANVRQRIVIATGGAAGAAGTAGAPLPTRTLREGVKGDDVKDWQTFLRSKGIETGPIDGIFGPKTRAATMAFQKTAGIKVDGVAGKETMRAAMSAGWGEATSSSSSGSRSETAGNVLRITEKCDSVEQAKLKATAKLQAANRIKATGSIELVGRTELVAGVTFDLEDMGRFSGRYSIVKSTHRADRSGGYTSGAEVSGV